jgi:hypothetical protein
VGMFTTTAPTGIVAGGIVATGITVDTENAAALYPAATAR